MIFLLVKLRFGVLVVLGGVLILAGMTGLVSAATILIIVGVVLAVIGLFGMFSKGGRIRSLYAKYRKIQRRNPNDPKLREILMKINKLKPGFAAVR